MKIRNLLFLAVGIGIGYKVAHKMREDDPNVLRGPQRERPSAASPAKRLVSAQAQRLADQAGLRSLDAIRRARGAIRSRLAESEYGDDAAWN